MIDVILRKPKWRMQYNDWMAYPSYAYIIRIVNQERKKKNEPKIRRYRLS